MNAQFFLSKAFDSVNHRLLAHKLSSIGLHVQLITWIGAFLSNRTFRVSVHGFLSDQAFAVSGLPQGSVLGPLLFLIFVNDLPDLFDGDVLLFADDVKLFTPRHDWFNLNRAISSIWDLHLHH